MSAPLTPVAAGALPAVIAGRKRRSAGRAPAGWLAALVILSAAKDLGGGALLHAQSIPAHPRDLRFTETSFELPAPERFRHVLSNGVVVYVVEDHALPLVDVAAVLRAGAHLEPADKPGLANLTAALLRRGGTETLTPEALDERLDFLAADLDASAGNLRAGVGLDCTSAVLDEALDLFFDVLRRPRFDTARLELAKSNLAESFRFRNDDPLVVLGREWSWLMFGRDHFTTLAPVPASLARIGREDLVAFHRKYWHPGELILAVSGDVATAKLLAGLERRFVGWARGERAPWPPEVPQHRVRAGLYHLERDLPQAKLVLGHLGAVRRGWDDPDFFPLTVLSEMLGGGGAVSRIPGRLRGVEGLAYSASASFGIGDLWPGVFAVRVETKNESVGRALAIAREEIERLRRQAPSDGELAIVKRGLLDAFPYLFDSAEEIAGYYAEDDFLGRPHGFWQTYRQRIARVSPADVRRVALAHLKPDELVVLTLGRWGEIATGDGRRGGSLREVYDGGVTRLPVRDPLTLEP